MSYVNVYIEHGFSEGKWHSRKLENALKASGKKVVGKPEKADVIIAHSGGCYMLPHTKKHQLVVLVGLPHWPDKHILRSTYEKVRLEATDWYLFKKTYHSAINLLNRPSHWIAMYKGWKSQTLPNHEPSKVLHVCCTEDTYAHQQHSKDLAKKMGWQHVEVSGQHDHLWQYPEEYIKLIDRYF